MHMKSVSIDHETHVLGSMNWTGAGNSSNDENVLLIKSPWLANSHDDFFEGLWASSDERWAEYGSNLLPEPMDSPVACGDTFDKNFDALIDQGDPSYLSAQDGLSPDSHHVEPKASPT